MRSLKDSVPDGRMERGALQGRKHVDKKQVIPFLRRLVRRDCCARRQTGDIRRTGGWHIVSRSGTRSQTAVLRSASSAMRAEDRSGHESTRVGAKSWPCDVVQHALSEGLVELHGDIVCLSSSGAAFLRRAAASGDNAYAEQQQVRSVRHDPDHDRVTVNECESPLGWLRNRKDRRTGKALISESQFDAGERLRQDFHKAQMSARVTADWSCALSGGRSRRTAGDDRVDITDAAIAAKTRFYKALDGVGEELSDVLVWVCCEGKGLRDVEQTANWPQRSGKLMLQMALRALARYYGLEPSRQHRAFRAGRVSHWGSEDYRPTLADE